MLRSVHRGGRVLCGGTRRATLGVVVVAGTLPVAGPPFGWYAAGCGPAPPFRFPLHRPVRVQVPRLVG